jgi:hypothetical protein
VACARSASQKKSNSEGEAEDPAPTQRASATEKANRIRPGIRFISSLVIVGSRPDNTSGDFRVACRVNPLLLFVSG